jgi:hypothetical protein
MNGFEKVYTTTDYYDGPRGGIADFEGRPHVYASAFDDLRDGYTDTFLLMPIDDELFRLALEDWKTWCRWEDALHTGHTTHDTHPTLPEDRPRHDELKRQIGDRLIARPEMSVRARGEFRSGRATKSRRAGLHDVEVRWTKLSA